jgi:predicted transcriptional regulator YheO
MFIKDENDEVLGCLCINFDMSELTVAKRVIDELLQTDADEENKNNDGANKVNDVLTDIVQNTLEQSGKPVAYMSKEEKVSIVKKLDLQGAFLIKGAIDYVAKVLCVSRYTIYNYLDEIRVDNK